MLTEIHPKLPMRAIAATKHFYIQLLGFAEVADYGNYLIVRKDNVELHFFEHKTLVPEENYGQVYIRTNNIEAVYQSWIDNNAPMHPNGRLEHKPWGQIECAIIDPDHNLLTFGQAV